MTVSGFTWPEAARPVGARATGGRHGDSGFAYVLVRMIVGPHIHSTDAFGYTEAIFATSHLTGFSYAPRFKNLKRQRLYIFRSRQSVDRSAWKIKPAAYCDEQHIIQFWDDILRFIATIKLKETTASDIFRRLNSYSKQHGLYHASAKS